MQPLADYLAEQLIPYGIVCGKVVAAKDVAGMIERINQGEVDIYIDSAFPATLVSRDTGAQPILRHWRNCDPEYYSVIVATAGSGITSIDELPGRVIGMDRPDSTSGFALPASYLIENGLALAVKNAPAAPVPQDEVGIFFTRDDDNTYAALLSGTIAAGATDDFRFTEWQAENPGKLVLLANTPAVPRRVVLLRPGLDSALQAAITDALIQAEFDPKGKDAMEKYVDTCRFDDFPEGIASAIAQMGVLYEKVKDIPGWQDAFENPPQN
jgi:phosphonate transport system substrate-binding protein